MFDMRRRDFITLVGATTATWPFAARAQQPGKLPTIGYLGATTPSAESQRVAALVQRLREFGWIESRNLTIEYRYAEGRGERYTELAAEFVRLNVDVIVTYGTPAVAATKQATAVIPIVFAVAGDPIGSGLVASLPRPGGNARHAAELAALAPDVIVAHGSSTVGPMVQATHTVPIVFPVAGDPVASGYVDSLARPGGNTTGFMSFEYSLGGKWLELLKEVAPAVRRAAVFRDPAIPSGTGLLGAMQSVAPTLGIEAIPINVRDARQRACAQGLREQPHAQHPLEGPPNAKGRSPSQSACSHCHSYR